jgi:hypothetical protein
MRSLKSVIARHWLRSHARGVALLLAVLAVAVYLVARG